MMRPIGQLVSQVLWSLSQSSWWGAVLGGVGLPARLCKRLPLFSGALAWKMKKVRSGPLEDYVPFMIVAGRVRVLECVTRQDQVFSTHKNHIIRTTHS